MFAARTNQENAVYERQIAGAAKPLNQGVKGLAPKTPGKLQSNDENAVQGAGKTGGKGKQIGLLGDGKGGKVDSSAFVTPAGPRNRAPLGNKTTNVKANGFKTPAPGVQEKPSAKQTSPRQRRAKIKVHEAEAETKQQLGEDEREVEHMAPRETPLPDHPDDCWPIDRKYPQFEGKNMTKGWWSEFAQGKGDSDDDELSDLEEKLNALREREQKAERAQAAKKGPVVKRAEMRNATAGPLATKQPSSLSSKRAASALSNTTRRPTAGPPSFAAPTTTTKARLPSALTSRKQTTAPPPSGNARFAAAKVASNSTLGYSKGRAVSTGARKPLAGLHKERAPSAHGNQKTPAKETSGPNSASLDELFGMQNLHVGEEADAELRGSGIFGQGVDSESEDEALKDFQLADI